MVKLQIVSDLHIETGNDIPPALSLITPEAEVLVLAGDIGRLSRIEQLKPFLIDVCSHFQCVLYVLGNHEFYKDRESKDHKSYSELLEVAMNLEKEISNLTILHRRSVVIDNVCIVGCTLWSQPYVEVPSYIVRIKGMNTESYTAMHKSDLKYIERMVRYCSSENLRLVVVTHHAPSYTLLGDKYKEDRFRSLYASNLDYLLTDTRIHTWIYGHTHKNFDIFSKNNTRIVSNQKGKPKDKVTDYEMGKIIKV